jgi:general secretion pathway protein D
VPAEGLAPALPAEEPVEAIVTPPAWPPAAEPLVAPPVNTDAGNEQGVELPSSAAALSFSGPQTIAVGTEVSLEVMIDGAGLLHSAPLFVNYDPALLEFVDAQEGPFLRQTGQTTVFSFSPNAAAGQVVIGSKLDSGSAGASGSGTLFTLRFRGKAPGTARLELNRINFRDPAGKRLAVEPAVTEVVIR